MQDDGRRVAPLNIVKGRATPSIHSPTFPNFQASNQRLHAALQNHFHITPPLTPHGSREDMMDRGEQGASAFHNYLRAFYPFHPTAAVSPSTVTLPLDQGDIILVHTVHTNGWADGTLLETGARGWLPTNYCEAYDQISMRPLLKALTDFWDTIRGGCCSTLKDFGNQDYMRGMIAGVRFLLVSP